MAGMRQKIRSTSGQRIVQPQKRVSFWYAFRGWDDRSVNRLLSEISHRDQIRERMVRSELLSDPGLLQKNPDIAALLAQGGGDGEPAAAAERAMGGLHAPAVGWQSSDRALDHRWPPGRYAPLGLLDRPEMGAGITLPSILQQGQCSQRAVIPSEGYY